MSTKAVFRQYLAAFLASLSVLMTGTSYGWINPLLVHLLSPSSEVPMTAAQSSWVVALIELGDLFTPLPAAVLVDSWGRKPLLLLTGPIYIFSWVLVLMTRSVYVLYFVRIIQGCAMGVVYTVLPMYLAEIAHPKVRGSIGTLFEGMWCLGILMEYCLGPYVSYQQLNMASLVVPVVFLLTFVSMPESPYFLSMVNRPDLALESLAWLRGNNCPKDEMEAIGESVKEEMKLESRSWKDLFATPVDRRAFIIVQIATLTKFMSGIGAILSYSSQTFGETSRSFLTPEQFTIAMGVLTMLATLIASATVDSMGRRPLLLASAFGCAVFELLAALYYYLDVYSEVDMAAYSWVAFAAIASYCVIFSLGIGPLVPILQAELFPANTRGLASGITTLTDTITCLIYMKLYQVVESKFGVYVNYLMYSISSMVGLVVMYAIVPETKGRSFSQIQAELSQHFEETSPITAKPSPNHQKLKEQTGPC